MNVLWEAMVEEMRAERTELDNRRHFTPEKQPIELVRALIAEWTTVDEPVDLQLVASHTAANFHSANEDDLFEMG